MCACELQSSHAISGPDSAFSYHVSKFPPNAKSREMSPQYTPQLFVWLAEFAQKFHSVFLLLNEVPSMLISKKPCSFWALFILKMGSFFSPSFVFFINMSTLLLNIKGFSRNQFYHFCLGVIWMFRIEIKSTKIDFLDLWDIPIFNSPSVCADTMQSRNEASGSPTFHLWTLAPDVNHS